MPSLPCLTRRTPELVALAYAVVSALWIFFSDRTLALFAKGTSTYELIQTYKGLGFITASALVLYVALRAAWNQLAAAHEQTKEAERRLADVIRGGEVGTWQYDLAREVIFINDRWAEILGYSRAEIEPVGIDFWNRNVHPDDLARMQQKHARQFAAGEHAFSNEIRLRHKDGHWVWIMSRGRVTGFTPEGKPALMSGVHMDISRRKALEDALQVERNLLSTVMETSVSAILAFDGTGRIIFANREAEAILGAPASEIVGARFDDPAWGIEAPDGGALPDELNPYRRALTERAVLRDMRFTFRHPQKGRRMLSVNVAPVERDDSPVRLVSAFTDLTEQIAAQRALAAAAEAAQYQALHDAMTGLPNRTLFRENLEAAVARGGRLALIFMDLDNFKQINDRYGHSVGDSVILNLGRKLQGVLPAGSDVARVGGDEFTILVWLGCDRSLDGIVGTLVRELGQPMTIDGNRFYLTASYGVSLLSEDAGDADAMIRNADLAMYAAKARGRNQCVLFEPAMRERSLRMGVVSQGLQRAIRERRLELFLQPKVALNRGCRIVGAEALLRWNDPELGDISPGEFVPVAESCGLIRTLDFHVIDLLGDLLGRWRGVGLHLPVFVNVSAESLGSDRFADGFLHKLDEIGVPPSSIGMEITESALLDTSSATETSLSRLAAAGVTLSVDDFGTGYSSLGYLHRLALTELKIDRSFVMRLGQEQGGADAIVRAILAMARALGLRTVAEGVETDFQRDWLIAEGCEVGQGYLFGKPMTVRAFESLVLGTDERPAEMAQAEGSGDSLLRMPEPAGSGRQPGRGDGMAELRKEDPITSK